ncbi:aspartate/glutamate racemase family protein [Streptomyces sp. DH24]|uniref:aspartate/glutamate racemase family protein n=1 Tax=Streptomyces sp. DH24 TaxID=3040123 RepID=UPI0024426E14|nr:aspartate/glutamate racemase family protein [Streptomyces sp. DH24]MDG9718983.1 aspartate/glutamate racemase family protein [Streptomyces sp. DH24]
MLALLHTSPVHVPVFDALRDQDHPGLELRHVVLPRLLDRARRDGAAAVADDVRTALRQAVADGARAVLCTCSTLGGVAEAGADDAGVPVLRVDRPTAAAAVALGPRVAVLATLESTLGPTVTLVEEEAARAGRPVEVRTRVLGDAWRAFEAGDTERCARLVANAADAIGTADADAIVLAQASMAPAERLTTTSVPVLSSPRRGLEAGARVALRQ